MRGKADQLKAWLPGGASTGFLLPEHLDLPLDFDTVGKEGSRLGTGLLTVVPQEQSMVALMRNLEEFLRGNPVAGAPPVGTGCRGRSNCCGHWNWGRVKLAISNYWTSWRRTAAQG